MASKTSLIPILFGIALFMLLISSIHAKEAYDLKRSNLRRDTSSNNTAWNGVINPTEVRVCEGKRLDLTCVTLDTRSSNLFNPRFFIRSVKLGKEASLKLVRRNGRPSYTAFLPINGHGTEFLEVWLDLQDPADVYTVEPPPANDEPYFYYYRTSTPDSTGVFLTEGKWQSLYSYMPYGGLDGGVISSAALAGPVLTSPHYTRVIYGGQELDSKFKLDQTTVVNQWKTDMVGNWVPRVGGGGGGGEFAVFTGYEYSKEDISIDKQINSITVKASLGFKFGPVGGGTEVTGHTALEQTRQTTERTTRSEKKEIRWTCPVREDYPFLHLYQWELSGQFAGPGVVDSPDPSNSYADTVAYPAIFQCVYAKTAPAVRPPKCVPVLCKDANCQTCCKGIDDPTCQTFRNSVWTVGQEGALVSSATYEV